VGQFGRKCSHLGGAGGCFEAGDGAVVIIVNIEWGCAAIVSSDVAVVCIVLGCSTRAGWGAVIQLRSVCHHFVRCWQLFWGWGRDCGRGGFHCQL
jgi:hypothetical protein